MDGAQPQVARGTTAFPVAFDMFQKLAHDGWRQFFDCHSVDCMITKFGREW
ncbi:hypothetical protein PAMC26577_07440 [Caballeronia sordidicola]|uniref:Uncharacterized protein n=1 Tax=Caballeronia sordidicola TaxID=196367 RepID=A0A242N277_CABSO|nr:hypothetical protein PAMC26577_07440 [Caballeronia sordidicola]